MIAARQIFLGRGGAKLPYDAEVEYLESTGTQYINLGLNTTTDNVCDFEMKYSRHSGALTSPFGYRYGATARYGLWINSASETFKIGIDNSNAVDLLIGRSDTNVHTLEVKNGHYVEFDGTKTTIGTGTVKSNIDLLLFAMVTSSSGASSYILDYAQIYSFKIYNANGDILRDMVPVRVGMEGAMMDNLTRRIYRNAGTGNFSYGADKTS